MAASIGITTALALSLFNDGAAVNLSLIILHSTNRAAIITVDTGGIVDNNGEFVNFHFFFLNFLLKI